jgi:single-strand DNA-binding protein
MASTAHVTVIGHLGADADLDYTQNGVGRLRFRVAVNDGTAKEPHTTWYSATMLGNRAERWAEWELAKGQLVAVIGRLSVREWESKQGERRYTPEVLVDQVVKMDAQAPSGQSARTSNAVPF